MSTSRQTNIRDRLYELLPSIHQLKDERQGFPLKALLGVVGEQAEVLEDNIRQLYENWFIETCDDWVVPYIGDLIGYQQPANSGPPIEVRTDRERMRQRVLVPRREVGNTIRNRRRKGTLAILEELARDVADWPARAVEFYRLLAFTQALNHQRPDRGRTVDFRDLAALQRINSPFDQVAHTLDVRGIDRHVVAGRYGLFDVGLFVWRLNPYSLTKARAKWKCRMHKKEPCDRHLFTFDPLGNDTQLFTRPAPEEQPTDIAGELNLPVPIQRHLLRENPRAYYGPDRSFQIWRSRKTADEDSCDSHAASDLFPIAVDQIVVRDLSRGATQELHVDEDDQAIARGHDPERVLYGLPKRGVAVDPETGRLAFPENDIPAQVLVTYHYGFSADLGGGEYERTLHSLTDHTLVDVSTLEQLQDALRQFTSSKSQAAAYGTGQAQADAKGNETKAQAREVVIEISNSDTYVGEFDLKIPANVRLQIRAANGHRPLLVSGNENRPVLKVSMEPRSRFAVDGLVMTGLEIDHARSGLDQLEIYRGQTLFKEPGVAVLRPRVTIRHCTIPPTWKLQLSDTPAQVTIQHSIIAMIDVRKEERVSEPLLLDMSDCILDPGIRDSAGHCPPTLVTRRHPTEAAHAVVRLIRCTVLGSLEIHSLELAENCIFIEPVKVSRPEFGCMRFCYVDPRSIRTPRRYQCQPDLALQAPPTCTASGDSTPAEVDTERVKNHIRPRFTSTEFGAPGYCQLGPTCSREIARGAEDESEMGVFHDLYQPQREASLQQRLQEFVPAETEAGIIFAT